MLIKFSAYKENGDVKPTTLVNAELRKLGIKEAIMSYELASLSPSGESYEPYFAKLKISGIPVTIEYSREDLYLDDEDSNKKTGTCPVIVKISTDSKESGDLNIVTD